VTLNQINSENNSRQMKKIILILMVIVNSTIVLGQEISGQWNGLLKVPGAQLRIVLNISKTEAGYVSTMDSPDQGAKGIPVATTTFENSVLKLGIPVINGSYEGVLNKDNIIEGKLTQNGQSFEVNLSGEMVQKQVFARPQEPKKPYPYYTEEVKIVNKKANITLAGTLSLPKKEGNFPAVILITGSGALNRDEEIEGHKPFLVLSDYLTKKGIAVLRLDDRGVGESGGDSKTAITQDFATDIQAGVDYLKTRNEVNQKKIGLIGHSEGGVIGPMVAGNSKDIHFIVLLAGPGLPGDKLLLLQNEMIKRQSGMPEVEVQKEKEIFKGAYDLIIASAVNDASLKNNITAYLKTKYNDDSKTPVVELLANQATRPWMYNFIKLDPVPFLQKVKCPVLALNGGKDLQVPAVENLEIIKKTLTESGNKKVVTKVLPNLNHLFQECETGLPSEYKLIEQTFSPIALEEISAWVLLQTK
jgi:fermentation-respiration switch protein FrsA (DUF1100 family)